MTAAMLIVLAGTPLPDPYYCQGPDGRYDLDSVCNPAAAESGGTLAILMCLAAVGYVMADVAADGLTVTYARREPRATRGQTQTTAYMTREVGMVLAHSLVGFGMNGPEYNGTFAAGISFNTLCALLAVPALAMVPVSWYLILEPRSPPSRAPEGGDPEDGAVGGGGSLQKPLNKPLDAALKSDGERGGLAGGAAGAAAGADLGAAAGCATMLSTMMGFCSSGAVFDVMIAYAIP